MKRGYLAISYSNRSLFDKEVDGLKVLCKEKNIDLLVFVDKYNFKANQEKEMMETAFVEIDKADFIIAELTTKAIGVGIEIGYAFARGIPIIYIRRKGAKHSTTTLGIANYIIEYENEVDLVMAIEKILIARE